MKIGIEGEEFDLLPERAIYWPKMKILFLADLHLGKINHFRRSGIPLPVKANDKNIEVLIQLFQKCKPERVICLGDLFHSHYNPEWDVFGEVVKYFQQISFELVLGNHDIMSRVQYERKGIVLHDRLVISRFVFTHHPQEEVEDGFFNIAGHVHPGVCLQGKGKQTITLPCFYFTGNMALLPAFGVFTGLARIKPVKGDSVYVIADGRIVQVSGATC